MSKHLFHLPWRYVISLYLLLTAVNVAGAQVKINGSAMSYAGMTLVVSMEADYISHLSTILATSPIGDDGKFYVSFSIDEVREVFLHVGSSRAVLYATPDKTYELIISPPGKDSQRKFDRTEVGLMFVKPDMTDINMFIPKFDADYDAFVNEHYLDFAQQEFAGSETYKASRGEDLAKSGLRNVEEKKDTAALANQQASGAELVHEFKAEMFSRYAQWQSNDFAYQYMRYRIAELELVASGFRAELYKEYFFSQPFLYNHPAYMQFFSTFFQYELTDALKGKKKDCLMQSVNAWRDFGATERCLGDNPLLTVEHMRHMVVLLGLRKAWHEELLLRDAIDEVLNKAVTQSKPEKVGVIAKNLQTSLGRHKLGWTPESFALPGVRRDTLYSDDLRGHFVYYYFYTSWSTTAKKEIQLLKKIHEQYKDVVTIVCINMDDNYNTFMEDMSNYRDCDWSFVYGAADPLLRDKFNVRTIPHACLVDTEGRYLYDYTSKPAEGVDGLFQPLVARVKQQHPGQGQKSWKD
ncbi:MAG: hypothetical protein JNM00_00430 [Flavobacteriales bacterium]|nr:hypothetical protein [Flavobacteriales bacterium]